MANPFPNPPGYENYKFITGYCAGIPQGEERIVWDGADLDIYKGFFDTGVSLTIVSSSDQDKVGGGGATEITFLYQGNDGLERSHVVVLNGTTEVHLPVGIKASISYYAYVSATEDKTIGGCNHGSIICYQAGTPLNVLWKIQGGEGRTQMCLYRVPLNKAFEIHQLNLFPQENRPVLTRLRMQVGKGYPWITYAPSTGRNSPVPVTVTKPYIVPPGATFCMTSQPGATDQDISCMVVGELKDYVI